MIPGWQSWLGQPRTDLSEWTERTVTCALFAAAMLMMSYNKADPDLWGHWQYGLDAEKFGLPQLTTYSYTVTDYRWVNHEWISEWLLARGWLTFGAPGLLLGKCLLGLAVLVAVYRRIRGCGFGTVSGGVLMLAVGYNLMLFWKLRPQTLSFALLLVTLFLLDRAFGRTAVGPLDRLRGVRFRYLWLLPPLMALWTNLHGAFAAGLAVIVVYLAGRAGQYVWSLGRRSATTVLGIVGTLAATAAATLLNPYGWRLHRWMWESLSQPRPEIIEWLPPALLSEVWLPFWLLAAGTVAGMAVAWRRQDLVETAVLAALLWQACRHHRHVALFVIAAAWWAPFAWRELFTRFHPRRADTHDVPPRPVLVLILLASTAAALGLGGMALARCRSIVVLPRSYPVDAFQFMRDHGLDGRMVVQFRWAQYALAAFGNHEDPRGQGKSTVAFDGRFRTCYPQSIVDASFDFILGTGPDVPRYRSKDSPPFDPTRILRIGHPDLVLIDVGNNAARAAMRSQQQDWVLLYRDGVAELWGRRSVYDDPHLASYLPPDQRVFTDAISRRPVPFPAFPRPRRPAQGNRPRRPRPSIPNTSQPTIRSRTTRSTNIRPIGEMRRNDDFRQLA